MNKRRVTGQPWVPQGNPLRARWSGGAFGRHRLDSKLLILFLVMAIAAIGLLWLASEVFEGDNFAFDRAILLAMRRQRDLAIPIGPHWLESVMLSITNLGGGTTLTLIVVVVCGALIASRKPAMAALVAASSALGIGLSLILKTLFLRPRPEIVPHLVSVSSSSFPSGHSMNSAVVYLTLAILQARAVEGRALQVYLLCSAVTLVVLIGLSRIYLGVHWPSDVLFGWGVGAAWAALSSLAAKSLQRRKAVEQPD
ncbi:phosphatase PAP2 family protein [Sphingomonas sp. ASV193]|uniref:phosphatase PAP2 family protein n=1 Tax=Sphingomonas sp. ASV193 TaxID=3144405 RepID=UPI0032E9074B